MPFSRKLTARLKNSMENAHQISLTLIKVEVWGVVDMHYFDLDLGTQTRPRYVVPYLYAKN